MSNLSEFTAVVCRLRRHRPDVKIGGDLWRCKCGRQKWRDEHSPIVWPEAGLAFGFSKVDDNVR